MKTKDALVLDILRDGPMSGYRLARTADEEGLLGIVGERTPNGNACRPRLEIIKRLKSWGFIEEIHGGLKTTKKGESAAMRKLCLIVKLSRTVH